MPRPLALITGGTSGIGYATSLKLADNFDLALVYRENRDRAITAEKNIKEAHPNASVYLFQQELMGHQSSKELYSNVLGQTKREPEVVVHSAGRGRKNLYAAADFSEVEAMINEHLLVAMSLTQLALPAMYKKNSGKIILIGSLAAQSPVAGQVSYAAAKAALEGFAKALSMEVFHRGITVNCIAPGLIQTPFTESILAKLRTNTNGKMPPVGQPEDVANLIAFLCSDEARHLSGCVIPMDAGAVLPHQ